MGKGLVSSINGVGKTGYPHAKERNWILILTAYTKINLKWIKDLNVRHETINLLEEIIGENLLDINLGNDFLDMTPKAQATKTKINKWDYIKRKCSAQRRKPSTKRKGNLWIERTYFQTIYPLRN